MTRNQNDSPSTLPAAEQIPVVLIAVVAGDAVEGDRVNTRVAEAETETHGTYDVPEHVEVGLCCVFVLQMEPQHEDVRGKEAHSEHDDEAQHDLRHLLPAPQMAVEGVVGAGGNLSSGHQMCGHQYIEHGNNSQRDKVVQQGSGENRSRRVPLWEAFRERKAHLEYNLALVVVAVCVVDLLFLEMLHACNDG